MIQVLSRAAEIGWRCVVVGGSVDEVFGFRLFSVPEFIAAIFFIARYIIDKTELHRRHQLPGVVWEEATTKTTNYHDMDESESESETTKMAAVGHSEVKVKQQNGGAIIHKQRERELLTADKLSQE